MNRRLGFFLILVFAVYTQYLPAQAHVSVPLDHNVYYLLSMAETRGLCSPLPAVKPYTREKIVEAINEILSAEPGRFGALTDSERDMLAAARAEFAEAKTGLDLWNGKYRFETEGKKGVRFSGDIGIYGDSWNSGAYYTEESKPYIATDTWGTLFFKGDIGDDLSFGVDLSAGLMRAQRGDPLGRYDTYATELNEPPPEDEEFKNRRIDVFSYPKAFFPYTYQKHWDGFMFGGEGATTDGMFYWPEKIAVAPGMRGEISGSVFGDMLLLRFSRLQREWGAMSPGSSLVYNAAARPFVGVEALFNPVPWFGFSSITGVLEFDNNNGGIYRAPRTFQSAFSLQQVEFNYKNYFHIDFGSGMIWAKRFELGYIFPLVDNFLYQNFIGKTDNASVHLNLKGRFPGLGSLWFSFYMDEMELSTIRRAFELDRYMFAYQAGVQGIIPGLPFASVTASYTKIEPYTYTHHRNLLPWYGDNPMEKAYINNGVSIGHYLPPNSDEIKIRFDVRPWMRTGSHLQYQLIRHGADFGPHQVDGSSLYSELDPTGRAYKQSLRKDFLNDGAYQWMHIIKIGAEHRLASFPITFYGEAGVVHSYFKDISDAKYDKYAPAPVDGRDTTRAEGEYKTSTGFILSLGVRLFK